LRPEAAGFEQASGDVVGEVAKAESGAPQVFEAAVDRFGRSVAGAGSVEVGDDVGGAALRVRPRVINSVSADGTPRLIVVMILASSAFAAARSGCR